MPRRFWVERLEERNVFSADPLTVAGSPPFNPDWLQEVQSLYGSGGLMPTVPFPLEQTFLLNSLPGATKTIYLDFDGHTTVNTQWNVDHDAPSIVTPTYDFDGDLLNFSDDERLAIQYIWERVAEDFRPFNVNVTTQDPGVDALRNLGGNPMALDPVESTDVGQTIGDDFAVFSNLTFDDAVTSITDINVTLDISHTWDSDLSVILISPEGTAIDLFSGVGGDGNNFTNTVLDDQATISITDPSATPPFVGSFRPQDALSAFNGENPNGTWTLLVQDNVPGDNGVLNGWSLTIGGTEFGDDAWGQRIVIGGNENSWYHPEPDIEAGGVAHIGAFTSNIDDPAFVFAGDFAQVFDFIAEAASHEAGHTLGLVHDGQFRFVRDVTDEDGDGMPDEDPPPTVRIWFDYYIGHGYFTNPGTSWSPIMGAGLGALSQWSKAEYFNATNDEEGVEPLQDDLAVITGGNGFGYRNDDHGSTLASATPLVADTNGVFLDAEGLIEQNTDVDYFSFVVEGLGELVSFNINPFHNGPNLDVLAKILDAAGNVVASNNPLDGLFASFTDLALLPGLYYLTVDGTSRPTTFIDPLIHPGPPDAMANTADPMDELDEDDVPIDTSDWGYTDYGSLGYYSITGSRKKELVVGVDFDVPGGMSPLNWTLYSGGASTTIENLHSETGEIMPWDLTISATAPAVASPALSPGALPAHDLPLEQISGYLGAQGETMSFVWSDLDPSTVYHIYVFGSADINATNNVTITGGEWLNETQISFTQTVSPNGAAVNGDSSPAGKELVTLALLVISDENGQITIDVDSEAGSTSAIAGLAISPTKLGTITGQKWNDVDGDGGQPEDGEEGLPGWMVYLDMNDNGQLDFISTPELPVTQASPDVPQAIISLNTVKSELNFTQGGVIADVNVSLDIAHTFNGDLNVYLMSPSGKKVKLFDDVGGNSDNMTVTIDDESTNLLPINPGTPTVSGTFHPDTDLDLNFADSNLLSFFDGEEAGGIWTLEVFDDAPGGNGQINGWSITVTFASSITYLEPLQITDEDGNYTFTDVKPGQYFVREHIQEDQAAEGWRQSWAAPPVTVTSGADVTGVDFGNWIPVFVPGAISGQVWHDVDGNGTQDEGDSGLADWQVYLDLNNNGMLDVDTAPSTIAATDLPKEITDFSTVTSIINVVDGGTIRDIEVTLDITHSFVGDLDAFLTSPSGRIVELFTRVGSQYNDFNNLTLADDAAESIASLSQDDHPFTGRWKPEGFLSEFLGDDAAGNWTLTLRDTRFADLGTLNSWSISIAVGEPVAVTDQNGDYSFDNLPPESFVVREVQKPGWAQTYPLGDSHNVTVIPGNPVVADFGNETAVALLGDFNRDGYVDNADWVMHRKTLNTTVANSYDGADSNGDGHVTEADLLVWNQNFGKVLGGGGGSAFVGESEGGGDAMATLSSSFPSDPIVTQTPAVEVTEPMESTSKVANVEVAAHFEGFHYTANVSAPSAADSIGTDQASQSSQPASEAAVIAWLSSLDNSGDAFAIDEFADLNHSGDDSDGEASDELEGIDALFELIGA